jgi:hypothetical protein
MLKINKACLLEPNIIYNYLFYKSINKFLLIKGDNKLIASTN